MQHRRWGADGRGRRVRLGAVTFALPALALLGPVGCTPTGADNGPPRGTAAGGQAGRPPRGGTRVPPGQPSAAPPSEGAAALRAARPPILPDTALTPGAALDVTAQDVCTPGYARRVRNVPSAVKRQAYAQYGITAREPGEYEVDHLISLEVGGSNSIRNLWPESFRTQPWNARTKDRLENELHRLVCAGRLDLAAAQEEIAGNWVAAYRRRFGDPPGAR